MNKAKEARTRPSSAKKIALESKPRAKGEAIRPHTLSYYGFLELVWRDRRRYYSILKEVQIGSQEMLDHYEDFLEEFGQEESKRTRKALLKDAADQMLLKAPMEASS